MTLRLWIKGSPQQAEAAAKGRGVTIKVDKWVKSNATIAEVDHAHFPTVVAWFCEDPPIEEGKGFPAGTLLLYSERSTERQRYSSNKA